MIIVNIIGGLGNQMFQYAAARALSLQLQEPLKMDVSGFHGYALHQGFELQKVFNCRALIADPKDIQSVLGHPYPPRVLKLLARPALRVLRPSRLLVEPHFHHWRGISSAPHDCFLMGYWQSEKYFDSCTQTIRDDFRFSELLSSQNLSLHQHISEHNAISVHVRRGDYVSNPKALATHGVASLDYYRSAIQHMMTNTVDPIFVVFSDDIGWVSENLNIEAEHLFVDHNHGSQSFVDMQLMSACRHHIIANSSFSWWGAWLNPNPSKIVIAPKAWFANEESDSRDIIPPGWIRL